MYALFPFDCEYANSKGTIQAPYYVPDEVKSQDESSHQFEITKVIQDDLLIDIATMSQTDSIMMSIDAGAHLMNESQADALISRWVSGVEKVLGV